MSTSGSINFTRTRDQLIKGALRKCGILAEGETASAQQIEEGAEALNVLVKYWKSMGINLWCYQDIAVFPVVGQAQYNIGATGDRAASTYFVTTLSADAAASASTITLTNVTLGSYSINGWVIGVVLDDGAIQWTTVNGAPSGYVVTLTVSLTGAATSGNIVYVYQTLAQRPLRISAGRLKINNGNEVPMAVISRQAYKNLPLKTNQGKPTQLYYDPQLVNGIISIWSTFETVNDYIIITAQREIQDFDTLADEPDLPAEWLMPIIWGVADQISLEYGIDKVTRDDISQKANDTLQNVIAFDQEAVSITFTPSDDE